MENGRSTAAVWVGESGFGLVGWLDGLAHLHCQIAEDAARKCVRCCSSTGALSQ